MNRIHDGQKNMARDMDARIMSEEDGRKRDVDSVRMELDRVSRRLPDGQIATQDQVRTEKLPGYIVTFRARNIPEQG